MIAQPKPEPTWEAHNRGRMTDAAIDAWARLLIELDEKLLQQERRPREARESAA
ncbi:MAG: hypothetical protein IID44_04965 [Planctomycetes bacterium]|nr:hypothetical protein [Planctomycetota bacterium]